MVGPGPRCHPRPPPGWRSHTCACSSESSSRSPRRARGAASSCSRKQGRCARCAVGTFTTRTKAHPRPSLQRTRARAPAHAAAAGAARPDRGPAAVVTRPRMTVAGLNGGAALADPSDGPRVVLDARACAAGDTLTGRVGGAREGEPVVLVRAERRPRGERSFVVARADAIGPDGAFAITVPDGALPTAAGSRCALSYRVQSGRGTAAVVAIRSGARPHLDVGGCCVDRLIPNWDARRFRIEISD